MLICVLLAMTVSAASAAVEFEAGTLDIDRVVTDEYPQVQVEVTAPGDVGADALETAFTVLEDGEPRPVQVSRLPSDDVQTVLLIDTSGSMAGEPIAAAARAATAFLDQLPDGVAVAVVAFGSEATVLAPFTADDATRRTAITELVATGETALYDGVVAALAAFPEGEDAARSIVLLSDGGDTASATDLDAASAALADSGVRLQAIELRTDESDQATLARLADVSGGRVVAVDDANGLDDVYTALASQLVNRFRLSFDAEGRGETTVEVRLVVGEARITAGTRVALPAAPPSPTPSPAPVGEVGEVGEVVTVTGVWAHPLAVLGGGAAVFVGLLGLAVVLFAGGQPRRRLATESGGGRPSRPSRSIGMAGIAEKATLFTERQLDRRGQRGALNAALENAGVDLRPGEYLVLTGSGVVAAFAVGFLFSGLGAGILLALLAAVVARLVLSALTARRRAKFEEQLGDLLQLLSGSLRAGYGLLQAIDAVSREADRPTSDEFGRVVIESRLGRDVNQSLRALAERMQSEDFEWVVQAIEIHREVGGDLAEVLDTVAGTIRERNQIRRQVKALSAEGRYSAYVLLALPFVVAGLIALSSPDYIAELTQSAPGRVMLAIAVLLMLGGSWWMRKLTRLVF